MNRFINRLGKKQRQWLWFAVLWCSGLLAVLAMSGLIKLLMPAEG